MSPVWHCFSFVCVVILFNFSKVVGLTCYRCGTLTPSSGPGKWDDSDELSAQSGYSTENVLSTDVDVLQLESCDEFQLASTPKYLYEQGCPEGHVCTKIVTHRYEFEDEDEESFTTKVTVQRGCAAAVTASGHHHALDCGFIQVPPENVTLKNITQYEHACYCDSSYCNSARNVIVHASFVLLLVSLVQLFAS